MSDQIGDNLTSDIMKKVLRNRPITVMVAGLPRNGKSTALNNLLGLKLPVDFGVKTVTQKVIVESTTSQHGVRVCGIDTPGLQAIGVDSKKILDDMSEQIGQGVDNFTLLYCMSAIPAGIQDDFEIIKGLTDHFGDSIWKRCILVLTFCDTVRNENFKTEDLDEAYKTYLRDRVKVFKKGLSKCTSEAVPVKLILDCLVANESPDNNGMTDVEANDTIVAVPVAKAREDGRKPSILPGFNIGGSIDWTEYAFFEIMRKFAKTVTAAPTLAGGVVKGGGGAAVGAGIGGIVGLVGGPPGVVLGAGIGAVAGVAVGAVGTFAGYLWRTTH